MRKVILSFLVLVALNASAQTDLYLNSKWNANNLEAIKNYVTSNISSDYKLTDQQEEIADEHNRAFFSFTGSTTKNTLQVELKRGFSKTADTVISAISIIGYYPDVLKLYNHSFSQNLDSTATKKAGKAQPILRTDGGRKSSITFFRENATPGYWNLWIRNL